MHRIEGEGDIGSLQRPCDQAGAVELAVDEEDDRAAGEQGERHAHDHRAVVPGLVAQGPQPEVRHLLAVIRQDPSVGIAVPVVLSSTGDLKFSLRREPTVMRALGEAVLGGHRAARVPALGEEVRDAIAYVEGAGADWATGAAMFISRPALDAVGPWDERFFLYSEETDYALRLRDAGFTLRLTRRASVTHPGGATRAVPLRARIDTFDELDYFRNGGILHYVLRGLARNAA